MKAEEAWCVKVYENGKNIGRLGQDGAVVNRNIYANMYSQQTAEKIAKHITESDEPYTAKADRF